MLAKPLINLDIALLRACQSSTVVAASERIKRALLEAYDAYQVERGLRTWRSARVLTLGAYLRQRHDELLQADHSDRILLGANAQRLAWLGHTPGLTEIDFDALRRCRDRMADRPRPAVDFNSSSTTTIIDFFATGRALSPRAERRCWLTQPSSGLITAELRCGLHASPVTFIGFDVVRQRLRV